MPELICVDLNRCIFCRACEVACEREHHGTSHVFIALVEDTFAVPLACRHCEHSPCIAVCPTQALMASPEGIVMLEAEKCTGCTLCIFACPFGVISFDAEAKVVVKCDLCRPRLEQGLSPVCVATCPTGALVYGEYDAFAQGTRRRGALDLVRAMTLAPAKEW